MNIFGWKSAGRGYLRPAKTRVQQDRLPGLRGYALGSLGEWPRHYEAQMREGYLSNAIAQRAVRLIAEGLASAPLTANDARALELVRATSAGQALMETVATHLLLHGNAYIEILSGNDGRPAELFALRPERMTIEADTRGWPMAFVYKAGEIASRLPADHVIHIRSIHPLDDHYGLGCLGAASGAVATHNAATKWNKALLDNAARPSGALVYEMGDSGTLNGEQYARLKEELAVSFQGAGNAGRPMLLEGGLKWQAMALTPAEMDFAGLKEAAAREISLAFGVPPVLLGLPGDATYANYREANRALWNQSIIPLARKILDALAQGLRPYFDGLTLDLDLDAVPALAEDRERLWAQVGAADFLTIAEKRAAVGLGTVDEGAISNEAGAVEFKFNPWHDTENGQFTFKGQGQRFAGGGGSFGGGGASGGWSKPKPKRKNPGVKPRPRQRITVAPLPPPTPRGTEGVTPQKPKPKNIRLTEQTSSRPADVPKQVKPTGTPPAKPSTGLLKVTAAAAAAAAAARAAASSSIVSSITVSGFTFGTDAISRTAGAEGQLGLKPNQRRSRSAQQNAGKPDRLPSDHGGHYIAREFGGPEIPENHFAQDAGVNRGEYRKLEILWKNALKRKQEVYVKIDSIYKGKSKRPHSLEVKYKINGEKFRKTIPNTKGEK
jgi:HK97 family phage portal protein